MVSTHACACMPTHVQHETYMHAHTSHTHMHVPNKKFLQRKHYPHFQMGKQVWVKITCPSLQDWLRYHARLTSVRCHLVMAPPVGPSAHCLTTRLPVKFLSSVQHPQSTWDVIAKSRSDSESPVVAEWWKSADRVRGVWGVTLLTEASPSLDGHCDRLPGLWGRLNKLRRGQRTAFQNLIKT